ncbi:MAG: hypothetical protein LJE59_15400 [Chromatiaceae bacterium]|jgi:hypothetical protein|nr:hypothetical protein [Chromatiaceae bacterium]
MELLASMFVGKPQHILVVAVVFLAGYLALRFTAPDIARHPRSLLIASTIWGLYAAWEWLVQIKTPEANIRVDLLVIWPVLAIFSMWALYRTFR